MMANSGRADLRHHRRGCVGGLVEPRRPALALGGSNAGSAAVLLASAVFYVAAGLLGLRIGRGLLGPDIVPGALGPSRAADGAAKAAPAGIAAEIAAVAQGLWAALRHLGQRRKAAYALGSVGVHHALYGILLLQALLLYRNFLYPGGNANAALGHVTALVATSAVGFGLAAVLTPLGAKRMSTDAWITRVARHRPRWQRSPSARRSARCRSSSWASSAWDCPRSA